MKVDNNELVNYKNFVYDYAVYRIGNEDVAKDVTSETITTFLLSHNQIVEENVKGWLINTAKNFCHRYFDKLKHKQNKEKKYREKFVTNLNKQLKIEKDTDLYKAMNESLHSLKDEELRFILYYYQCGQSIKKMDEILDISYATLRKKLSIIRKILKAETFRKLGAIATKKIITPKLNDQIIKFLKRFKENLENGTLDKMYYYFSEVDLNNYDPSLEIDSISDYEVQLNDSVYKVWIIFNKQNGESASFFIEFFIDEHHHLKIITPPRKPKRVFKMNSSTKLGEKIKEIVLNAKINKREISEFSNDEIEQILKQLNNDKS